MASWLLGTGGHQLYGYSFEAVRRLTGRILFRFIRFTRCTRGAAMLQGAGQVKIHGQYVPIRRRLH